jgi:hypothetical protein
MGKIAREVAIEEIDSWLDKKKVYESTRETHKDSIDVLIDAVVNGDLTLDEKTNELRHKLLFPDAVNNAITELVYKPRLNDQLVRPHLNGIKNNDGDGRLIAHTAALTSQSKNILSQLDSADKKIMMSIVVFFL